MLKVARRTANSTIICHLSKVLTFLLAITWPISQLMTVKKLAKQEHTNISRTVTTYSIEFIKYRSYNQRK